MALGDAPPWTRKFLTDNWDTIRQGSMPGGEWMPVEAPGSTPKRRLVDALGCGHYGCVFLTNTPGLVIKVSSDASEAEFIKAAVKLGEWPAGIVRYQAVLDLPGSHRGRPVFIIWREEAFDIGTIRSTGDRGAEREFLDYQLAYLNAARFIRELSIKPNFDTKLAEAKAQEQWAWDEVIWEDGLHKSHEDRWQGHQRIVGVPPKFKRYSPAKRLAAALRICAICFELMENTNHASEVGGALGFYLNEGILLADVHRQNIGQVTRADADYGPQTYTVITDPGHAVFLR